MKKEGKLKLQNLNSYTPTSPKIQLLPFPSLKNDGRKNNATDCDDEVELEPRSSDVHQLQYKEENKSEGGKEEDRADESVRERLKRHRVEVAGQVWIPEIWGQEHFLQDWIDCSGFDSVPMEIMSARAALVEEGRRAHSGRLPVENSCS